MKLGRVAAAVPDGVPTLDYHPIMQATAPARLLRDHVPFRPTMGGNDQCGDCTCVALANAIHAQAALAGWDVGIPDGVIIALYSALSGFDAAKPDTDTGLVEVDLLAHQARAGFDVGGQTPYAGLWANVPADDLNLLRLVTARMGCGYLGVNLALADQQGGGVWDTNTPAAQGDPTPGSWGGHALLCFAYDGLGDDSLWELATWGYRQRATTRWLKSRLAEAHTVVHPQMLGPNGLNAAGLDRERLTADVGSFGADT